MPGVAQWLAFLRKAFHSEFVKDLGEFIPLAVEEAEFGFGCSRMGGVGVFDHGGQSGIGHHKSTPPATVELVGEQAEGVGVAVKSGDVFPNGLGEVFF